MSARQIRLIRLGLIVLLLALWELYARFLSTSSLVAGPSDVALAWWRAKFIPAAVAHVPVDGL